MFIGVSVNYLDCFQAGRHGGCDDCKCDDLLLDAMICCLMRWSVAWCYAVYQWPLHAVRLWESVQNQNSSLQTQKSKILNPKSKHQNPNLKIQICKSKLKNQTSIVLGLSTSCIGILLYLSAYWMSVCNPILRSEEDSCLRRRPRAFWGGTSLTYLTCLVVSGKVWVWSWSLIAWNSLLWSLVHLRSFTLN